MPWITVGQALSITILAGSSGVSTPVIPDTATVARLSITKVLWLGLGGTVGTMTLSYSTPSIPKTALTTSPFEDNSADPNPLIFTTSLDPATNRTLYMDWVFNSTKVASYKLEVFVP